MELSITDMIVCDNVKHTSVSTVNKFFFNKEAITSKLAACSWLWLISNILHMNSRELTINT